MNKKELGELRRRFRADRSAISRVYGCFVNCNREIVSDLDISLGMTSQETAEKYLGFLKKSLSGGLGKNLVDISFSTQQVMDSPEHRLLTTLRKSRLQDEQARQAFYQQVISSAPVEGNYLILLAHDAYDVPHHGEDGELDAEGSDQVFSYIVCAVCPIKDGKTELGYSPERTPSAASPARRWPSPRWAFSSRPLTTGRPTSTTPCSIPGTRKSSPRAFWMPSSTPSRPCPPGSRRRTSGALWWRPWGRSATWTCSRRSTSSWPNGWRSTSRARTRSLWP